ncbi:MAG: hypothetical protein IJI37_06090, partial [Opitutales bacterium]|nr:hypothetical protein [Opitutales bacterium]
LGVEINIANAVFSIFAVCVAQDYAVFLIHSARRGGEGVGALAAVLASAATTLCAFGVLALASHPMLKSLGAASAASIFSILCASLLCSGFLKIKSSGGGDGK